MSLTNAIISEIEQEAVSTQKMLERVPADKFDWRPSEKSMTLKQLASHIADLSGMTGTIASTKYLDFAERASQKQEINTTEDLLKAARAGTKKSVEALKAIRDEDLNQDWIMRRGEHIIAEMPKAAIIRRMGMNHLYHHRAQLGVYLRLLNVPVPGMYGPSADDKAQQAQKG